MKKLILMLTVVSLLAGCAPSYTVRYNGNEPTAGIPPIDPNHYTAGEEAVVRGKASLVKSGYNFNGWNTKNNGEGTSYKEGEIITIEDDVFLYAVWVEE